MGVKEVLKKIAYGKRYSSETYIDYLRRIGVKIGEDCTIYVPSKTLIDEQYPWMITIGNHVRITEGVKILTHDYSWSVLKLYEGVSENPGAILGASGTVKIGDNVFIGMNTIITRNVEIGNNVIIGAGSVVTSSCDHNGVYAGVPAKRIMSIDEYYEKRERAQFNEAKELAVEYFDRYGKDPGKKCSMSTLCYLKRLKRHKKMMYLEIKSHYAKMNWILLNICVHIKQCFLPMMSL